MPSSSIKQSQVNSAISQFVIGRKLTTHHLLRLEDWAYECHIAKVMGHWNYLCNVQVKYHMAYLIWIWFSDKLDAQFLVSGDDEHSQERAIECMEMFVEEYSSYEGEY